jgi:hypothetical protein
MKGLRCIRQSEYEMAIAHRSFALSVSLATVLAGTMVALSAELKDPLSPLTSAKGSMLCFRRDYSPAHLAQHPKQTTKSVLLAFQEGFVSIVLTPRMGARKVIGAGCDWAQGAGIDTSGHKMIPNFNKAAGFDCIVTVGNSAEERGYLLIDPAQDAKSLTLFLQSSVTAHNGDRGQSEDLELGPEDITFKLTRIASDAREAFKMMKIESREPSG